MPRISPISIFRAPPLRAGRSPNSPPLGGVEAISRGAPEAAIDFCQLPPHRHTANSGFMPPPPHTFLDHASRTPVASLGMPFLFRRESAASGDARDEQRPRIFRRRAACRGAATPQTLSRRAPMPAARRCPPTPRIPHARATMIRPKISPRCSRRMPFQIIRAILRYSPRALIAHR